MQKNRKRDTQRGRDTLMCIHILTDRQTDRQKLNIQIERDIKINTEIDRTHTHKYMQTHTGLGVEGGRDGDRQTGRDRLEGQNKALLPKLKEAKL